MNGATRLATFVSPGMSRRLALDLAGQGVLHHAKVFTDVALALETGGATAVAVELTLLRQDALDSLVAAVVRSGAGMLACLPLTAEGVDRLLAVLQLVPCEVQLDGHDDATLLRDRIRRLPQTSLPSSVLYGISRRVSRLPTSLRFLPVAILCGPLGEVDSHDLIMRTGMSIRSVERWLNRVGLASISRLRRVRRVAQSMELMGSSRVNLGAVATECGFGAERALAAAWNATVGRSPRRASRSMSREEVANALVRAMDIP